ncbi:MAG: hypothetical protein LUF92_07580 [Clostridiales bacterium]|nr:hypothetical protein [Clostridiales bacterium]
MKNKLMRFAAVVLSLILASGMMTGCGSSSEKGTETENGDEILFTYDGVDVTLKKAWIYAKITAAQYDYTYSSYFGEDFWTMDMGTDDDGNAMTFEDYVKQLVVSQIKQIIVLTNRADEADASLSDEEIEECAEYAKAFAEDESGAEILAECGATEEDMAEIYEENALASKVQEYMVSDADTDVSDDEARETTISRVVFDTTTTDDDGITVDMSDDEKAEVLATAQAALEELLAGTDIEDIADEQEYTSTSETFAAGESDEGEDFEALLATMEDGGVTQEVQECDNGYVIAQLVAYTDEDATEENRESIIEEREETRFSEVYEEWIEELEEEWSYQDDVNQELWAEVVFYEEESTGTEDAAETDTAAEEDTEETEASDTAEEDATETETADEDTAEETATEAE